MNLLGTSVSEGVSALAERIVLKVTRGTGEHLASWPGRSPVGATDEHALCGRDGEMRVKVEGRPSQQKGLPGASVAGESGISRGFGL